MRRMLAERYKGKEGRVRVYLYGVIAKEFDILMIWYTHHEPYCDLFKHLHTQGTPISKPVSIWVQQRMNLDRKIETEKSNSQYAQTDQKTLERHSRGD